MYRPFRAGINFVASFVGNFVAFVESNRESSREDAKNRNRECTNARENGLSGWMKCAD
jgi:hypothetical protein